MNRCEACIHEKVCKKWSEQYSFRTGNKLEIIICDYFTKSDKTDICRKTESISLKESDQM